MAGTAAWIDVLPNLSAFGAKLNSGVTAAATSAGRNAGKRFSDAMNQAASGDVLSEQVKNLEVAEGHARKAVNAATAQIAKARDEQKSAALRAQAAETSLSETVAKYGASSAQALNAQARLNDARSKARQKDEALKNAEEQISAAQNGLKETQNQLADAQRKASNTTGGFRATLAKWKAAADAARFSTGTLTEAQTRLGEDSRRTAARFGAMAGAVGGFASSIAGKAIAGIASLGSSMVDASDSAQKFASTMGFADVDADTIRRLTASTQEYADKTVFDLSDIRNTTAQLAANGVDNYAKLAEAAGNLTAVAGGGADAYKSVAMALTQTAGAGKLTTENWNQIADAIPGASGKLQKAMKDNGAYTGDFRDAMEKGQISADEFNQALLQLGMDDVAKKAAESTATFEGAMGNWEAAVQKLGMTVLDKVKPQLTGALDFMSDKVTDFTDWFSGAWNGLSQNTTLNGFLTSTRDLFSSVFDVAKNKVTGFFAAFKNTGALQTVSQAFGVVVDAGKSLGGAFNDVMSRFGALAGLSGDASAFGDVVGKAFQGASVLVDKAAGALGRVSGWVSQNSGMVAGALASIAGGFAAFKAATLITAAVNALKGFSLASTAAAAAQSVLNVAMNANPFVLTVTAVGAAVTAFTWFFTQTETGRNIVSTAWAGIQNAVSVVVTWFQTYVVPVFQTVWGALQTGFQIVGQVFSTVWNAIKTAFQVGFLFISTVVLTPFKLEFDALGAAFNWLYANVIQPVWAGIQAVFQAAWSWIDSNVIQPFQAGLDAIGTVFDWLYANVIQPVWAGIQAVFQAAWSWIDSNVIQPFQAGLDAIGTVFDWLYANVIQPVWAAISGAFQTAWNWIDQNVVQPFKAGMDALGQSVQHMKDMASKAWDSLKEAAASPVRFVVNTVYTNGIQKVWNGIAGAIGLDNLKLPDAKIKFASGGVMPGYTPGRDVTMAAVSGGEAIMRPEFTRAVGKQQIYEWNRLARVGGAQAVRDSMTGVPHYANGGVVPASQAIANANRATAGSGLLDKFGDFLSGPAEWVRSKILDPVTNMLKTIGGGNWGSMMGSLPVSLAKGLVDKAVNAVKDSLSVIGGNTSTGSTGGAGVERWRGLVNQVLTMLGQPTSWADTVLRRMNQESGGNPNAINNWDSNAKAGHPSQGLMQTIPGTFAAYAGPYLARGITDPLANIYAGVNYALHRYGSLSALNRAGGYALGGIVEDRPTLYDRGGILPPGRHLVANETRQPELVLTREQIVGIFGSDVKDKGDRTVNLNVSIPERSDPWSDASILVRTARHQLR